VIVGGEIAGSGPAEREEVPMGRRRLQVAVVSIAAVLAVAGVAAFATTASSAGGSRVVHLIGTETDSEFLSQGKASGLGDEVVFSGTLRYPGGDNTIGRFGGTLTQITPAGLQQAQVTLQLPDGQIAIQGVLDFAAPPYVHAITGGTGAYDGVGGEFTFTHDNGNTLVMTLTLERR
jgi:hypothetical protein